VYTRVIEIDIGELEPLCAAPHSPDKVIKVADVQCLKVNQVAIGSCSNGSYLDLMRVAKILKGKTIHPGVSLVLFASSKQILSMLAKNGALHDIIAAGARILESGCGPCIGMGQAPATEAVSLRTFNRNFKGRCGTDSAYVYLVSPETAAASALSGVLSDPRILDICIDVAEPAHFVACDNMIIPPSKAPNEVNIIRGSNIKPFPLAAPMSERYAEKILIKVGDNITTDHIMPSNAALLPHRSNIPYLANYCFAPCDEQFSIKAREHGGGVILAGENYGQGSSREHAALVPLYLGVKFVLAKSFARIHKSNLINSGIIPLSFVNVNDYDSLECLDELIIDNIINQLKSKKNITISGHKIIKCKLEVSLRELDILLCGGKINWIKNQETK